MKNGSRHPVCTRSYSRGSRTDRVQDDEIPLTLHLQQGHDMAAKQRSTVVGVFEDRRQADQGVAELKRAGFRDDQIGVAMRHTGASTETEATAAAGGETYAEE